MESAILGDYIVGCDLGSGAQAKVVFAKHSVTHKKVALKVYNLESEMELRGFRNEAETLAKLQKCESVISAPKSFETDGKGVIVMEIMRGDLLNLIIDWPLTQKEVARYFYKICTAVKYMHDMSMAHLDIKPENCLVDGNGGTKLCDFGNSITFEKGMRFRGKRGTRGYACPEMMNGEPFCPKEADMWSLGITLHILLTGCFPFEETGNSDVHFSTGELSTLFLTNPDLSPFAINLLSNLLCENPEARYTIDQTLLHPFFEENQTSVKVIPNTFSLIKKKLGRIVNKQQLPKKKQ